MLFLYVMGVSIKKTDVCNYSCQNKSKKPDSIRKKKVLYKGLCLLIIESGKITPADLSSLSVSQGRRLLPLLWDRVHWVQWRHQKIVIFLWKMNFFGTLATGISWVGVWVHKNIMLQVSGCFLTVWFQMKILTVHFPLFMFLTRVQSRGQICCYVYGSDMVHFWHLHCWMFVLLSDNGLFAISFLFLHNGQSKLDFDSWKHEKLELPHKKYYIKSTGPAFQNHRCQITRHSFVKVHTNFLRDP